MTSIARPVCLGHCGRHLVSRYTPIADCVDGEAPFNARGMCVRCYSAARDGGYLADYPRSIRRREDVLDDWNTLRLRGMTMREAAEYVGMRLPSFERAVLRARKAVSRG